MGHGDHGQGDAQLGAVASSTDATGRDAKHGVPLATLRGVARCKVPWLPRQPTRVTVGA
jgi:hypothetical protein